MGHPCLGEVRGKVLASRSQAVSPQLWWTGRGAELGLDAPSTWTLAPGSPLPLELPRTLSSLWWASRGGHRPSALSCSFQGCSLRGGVLPGLDAP